MEENMSRRPTFTSFLNPLLPAEGRRRQPSCAFFAAAIVTAGLGIGPQAKAKPPPAGCDVPNVVAEVLPAIVNIQNAGLAHQEVMNVRNDLLTPESRIPSIAYSVGTGFIISSDGLIVTNQHVIRDAIVVLVRFQDKTQVTAHLVGSAALQDIALLKVDVPRKLPTLSFGDSDALRVGQPVIAIGNPINVGTSVSTGSVSAVNRNLMRTPFDDYIQTDAAINPGNSGGPLLDCSGKVVGVDTALLSNNPAQGSIGLGFALPSDGVKSVVKALEDPKAVPNWIGVQLQDMNARLASSFHRPNGSGAIVTGVQPGSPAALAALVPGDIITSVGGEEQPDARSVQRAIIMLQPGRPVMLSVWHRGQTKQVAVMGEPWPNFKSLQSDVVPDQARVAQAFAYGLGLHVIAITDADRLRFGLGNAQGVLIDRVDPGTQAAELGVQLGDVIQQIGDEICTTPEQAMTQLAYGKPDADDTLAILVQKPSGPQWITVWVGRPNSRQFVTSGSTETAPTAHGATVRQ
jgi:serine protease Do